MSKRGQSTNGLKAGLLDHLKNALEQRLPVLSSASQAAHSTDDLTGFSTNARWKLLEPIVTAVEEPQNVVPMTTPTIPMNEAAFVPQKHNFSQIFDHAPFLGLEKIQKHHRNGRSVFHDGKPVFEEKVNVMGGLKTDFLLKHGLGERSSHFLSMICESIKWIECHKEVYCVETEQVEMMKILCLNINNSYNHDMGGVDIADQLRNYYRFDHWSRQ